MPTDLAENPSSHVGALIIRIGFWAPLWYSSNNKGLIRNNMGNYLLGFYNFYTVEFKNGFRVRRFGL